MAVLACVSLIYDIPIARITDSYVQYVRMLKELGPPTGFDINVAGEFLVMLATLLEIKSAMLLPKAPPGLGDDASAADELIDPRYELVQRLLEYKQFKDSAAALEKQQQRHQERFPRFPALPEGQSDEPPPLDLEEVQIWDLMETFERLMKEVGTRASQFQDVLYDETPIDLYAADIEDRVGREGRLSFRQLLVGLKSRSEMIGIFLALLELIRDKRVLVQPCADSPTNGPGNVLLNEFEICAAPAEHRQIADAWTTDAVRPEPKEESSGLS